MSIYCPSCGAAVAADATTCPVCGEPLEPVGEANATSAGTVAAAGAPRKVNCPDCGAVNNASSAQCASCGAPLGVTPAARASSARAGTGASSTTTYYLIGFVALVIIGTAIYLLSNPEPKTGPPQAAQESSQGLPQGHPPIDDAKAKEAINKRVEELSAQVAANPDNAAAHLELANALYDAERHQEALQHYQVYTQQHPTDLDAKTDFATSLAEAKKVDSAVVVLNSVIAADPQHQRAAFNMAIMYRQKDNRDSVIYWLGKVVAIDSTSPPGKAAVDILKSYESAHP